MNRSIITIACLALLLVCVQALGQNQSADVWLLDLQGPVGPATADHLVRGIEDAQAEGASAVILRMDTPGGLDKAMRDIIHAILEAEIPVISYVAPQGSRAASAGTYILYASHFAAMAPATNLGAATPVQIGGGGGLPGMDPPSGEDKPGEEKQSDSGGDREQENGDGSGENPAGEPAARDAPSSPDAMRNKVVNDARAYIRGLAELRGRNAEWAETAVTEAATLTASRALEKNVIDIVAEDVEDLLAQLDGRTVQVGKSSVTLSTVDATVKQIEPDWRTRFLSVITDPSVAYILLMVGIYGLIMEFSNPGMGAGGIVGAICLFLALYSMQLLPISYSALALLILGLGLMVAEAFSPSFGILGLGGIVAFIVGSIMLMDTDVPGFQIALPLILSLAAVSAGMLILVVGLLLKTRRQPAVSGLDTMVGEQAVVADIRNSGVMVKINGELWNAHSDQRLSLGDQVRVKRVSGLQLEVTKE